MKNSWSNPYYLTFAVPPKGVLYSESGPVCELEIAQEPESYDNIAKAFTAGTYENYDYVVHVPDQAASTMVVWLHGIGEGATLRSDPWMPVIGNKVIPLTQESFQAIAGPAIVIAPQCPTMWMDDGSGDYTVSGASCYTQSLIEFIDHFKNKYQVTNVVLVGCSNGGYMTLELLKKRPGHFTCAVPICPAQKISWYTDKELAALKEEPVFFVYSQDDQVVAPQDYELPILEKLASLGATRHKTFVADQVIDTSERYWGPAGQPYRYNGHWSWIYFFNNEAIDPVAKIDAWHWIAQHLK